jgi:hypothetical protein
MLAALLAMPPVLHAAQTQAQAAPDFDFPLWFEPEPLSARSRRSFFKLWLPLIKSAS